MGEASHRTILPKPIWWLERAYPAATCGSITYSVTGPAKYEDDGLTPALVAAWQQQAEFSTTCDAANLVIDDSANEAMFLLGQLFLQ